MKRILFFLFAACSASVGFAQSAEDALRQDSLKAACSFYVYDYKTVSEMTPAPEGYQPFYISHFARHGARYCTGEYGRLYGWLSKASEVGMLTGYGKEFFSRYEPFYLKVKNCGGNLTDLGKEQHRNIARNMFARFPEVFEGPTHIEAASTESPRVIMSMWSCLAGLMALDGDIEVDADASARFASWLQPVLPSSPYYMKDGFRGGETAEAAVSDYFRKTVPWKKIAKRFFTDEDVLEDILKITPEKFIGSLHGVVTGTYCLDEDRGCFDDVFAADELYPVWKGLSARYFLDVANYLETENMILDYSAFTVENIIESADADIASGDTQLRLRFGHDSGIAPLIAFLNLEGMGRPAASFDEGLEIFPSYNVPMGASVQLVFYRNAGGDILLKVLLNEKEATLPFEPVRGPYYRWADFKAHYLPVIAASKSKIERKYAERMAPAVLKSTDWGWRQVGVSKVEEGGATVNVFGGSQTISMVRFPMKEQSVSVVDAHGASADVTSRIGADSKALAAINGSYFDRQKMPVTFIKDEGRVCRSTNLDKYHRNNGMLRVKGRKGRLVEILKVADDSLTLALASEGWREALVSGPMLMEDGKPVAYKDDGTRTYSRVHSPRHPRSIVGCTEDGWIYFIVVDGRFVSKAEGMRIRELQILCEALGLHDAMNLDGGGSSSLWTSASGVLNHPCDNKVFDHDGERVVPNALIVK